MTEPSFDPELIIGWLRARSLARGLPAPVPDCEGWLVETGSPEEKRRHVFVNPDAGLRHLGERIVEPHHLLKLAASPDILMAMLPSRWRLQPLAFVMTYSGHASAVSPLPPGYRMDCRTSGSVSHARILTEGGAIAASGFAAETDGVFIFDRIVTQPDHQRRGLGRAIMATLGSARRSAESRQILTATAQGRDLYRQLGWCVVSEWSTAAIAPIVESDR